MQTLTFGVVFDLTKSPVVISFRTTLARILLTTADTIDQRLASTFGLICMIWTTATLTLIGHCIIAHGRLDFLRKRFEDMIHSREGNVT